MCGITGIFAFNMAGKVHMINLSKATHCLRHRGPDAFGTHFDENIGLGHRRLSIIDLSEEANQPMTDKSGRYVLVYNGEIYNYKELKQELEKEGISFSTSSDTEVLLQAFIYYGSPCLEKLNGFFAFAVFDKEKEEVFIARDRFGIKPLYYFYDEDKFLFASEMQSILSYGLKRNLDYESLFTYLQLNYIPAPDTIFREVKILMPGHFARVKKKELEIRCYYEIKYAPQTINPHKLSYHEQQKKLQDLMDGAVQKRLVADVPLGTFLSGGIDSSVITGIAKKYVEDLHTFSIGYSDEPYFDETRYANLVAKKLGTRHTVFSLATQEIEDHLVEVLDKIDQPFADSSALPVYILSQKTKEHITVALSGDGADELFSGYNKHSAFLRSFQRNNANSLLKRLHPILSLLPQSRSNPVTNKLRQIVRYSQALNLDVKERYWQWAALAKETSALDLLAKNVKNNLSHQVFSDRKQQLLKNMSREDLNEVLLTDMQLVLPNDMLKKVDLMSMAHGLEVRVPFLDKDLVDFVFSLQAESKIDRQMRKKILQDAYRDMLPPELYNRPKHGFEVPLLKWFRGSLRGMIENDTLNDTFISEQGLFDLNAIQKLKKKLFSLNPGDVHAQVWALIVFQHWWKKYMQ